MDDNKISELATLFKKELDIAKPAEIQGGIENLIKTVITIQDSAHRTAQKKEIEKASLKILAEISEQRKKNKEENDRIRALQSKLLTK